MKMDQIFSCFVLGVIEGNEGTGWVQGLILLLFMLIKGRVSPRFPCLTSVMETFSSGLQEL